jgi:hypothetical protein
MVLQPYFLLVTCEKFGVIHGDSQIPYFEAAVHFLADPSRHFLRSA